MTYQMFADALYQPPCPLLLGHSTLLNFPLYTLHARGHFDGFAIKHHQLSNTCTQVGDQPSCKSMEDKIGV